MLITDNLCKHCATTKGAQKSPPENGDLWKVHGYFVSDTGIEPRPEQNF